MPSSYQSFQGKEPNIDVNLFVNALTQGIAAGNAQKTTFGAIAEGVKGAISGGIETYQGVQQIQSNAAKLEVDADPAVIAARRQSEIAKGEAAQTQADIQRDNRQAIEDAAELEIQQARDAAQIKAQDAAAALQLDKLTRSQDLQAQMAVFQDPTYSGYLSRNPGSGQAYVQALKMRGGDPAVLDPLAKQFSEMDYAVRSRNSNAATRSLGQKAIEQQAVEAGRFENTLLSTPEADKYVNANNVDYRLFSYEPSQKVNKATGTSPYYDLKYGSQIIKADAITKDQFAKEDTYLKSWIATKVHELGPKGVPPSVANPSTATTVNQQTKVQTTGIGLASGTQQLTEKDITPPPVEKLNTPFLKGAVEFGGFTPETVEKNIPAFNSLSKTIQDVVKSPTPDNLANRELLQGAINSTAKQIATTTFNTYPSLQSLYTMSDVEAYNKRFAGVFGAKNVRFDNVSSDAAKAMSELRQPTEVKEDTDKQKKLVEDLYVKTPADVYFATAGSGYVKQVKDYSDKVLLANKRAKELQIRKATRNSNTPGIIAEMSGG